MEPTLPAAGLLGQIMGVVEDAGATENIHSPITAVEWFGGQRPATLIRTGFSR